MKPNSAISTAKRDDEHPRHDFQTGVPGVSGWGDRGWGGMWHAWSTIKKKTANFFQEQAGRIFVLEYTEENGKFLKAMTI